MDNFLFSMPFMSLLFSCCAYFFSSKNNTLILFIFYIFSVEICLSFHTFSQKKACDDDIDDDFGCRNASDLFSFAFLLKSIQNQFFYFANFFFLFLLLLLHFVNLFQFSACLFDFSLNFCFFLSFLFK